MPAFEAPLIEIHNDPAVPWTVEQLDELLHAQDLRELPRVKEDEDDGNKYIRMLDGGFVLRVHENAQTSPGDVRQSERQLTILGGSGTPRAGILIPPHRTFLQEAPGRLLQPYRNVYTIVKHVDGGANLRDRLKDPSAQIALLGIGRRLTAYFGKYKGPGDERLVDISGHYQYSPSRTLYDLAHDTSDAPNEIGDELNELRKWIAELLPSHQQERLHGRAIELCERWPYTPPLE